MSIIIPEILLIVPFKRLNNFRLNKETGNILVYHIPNNLLTVIIGLRK